MSKENPWFKFEPSEWIFGRIQRQSEHLKVVFLDLMCKYWHKECKMTLEDAELDFGKDEIQTLLQQKIILNYGWEHEPDHIHIDFLDIQMEGILETSHKNSLKGIKSGEVRRAKAKQQFNNSSTTVQPKGTDKKREDEIKENNKSKGTKKFVKPTLDDLIYYFIEKGLVKDQASSQAQKFLDHYDSNGWKIGGKSAMKDWKAAVRSNWLTVKFNNNVSVSGIPSTPNMIWYKDNRRTADDFKKCHKQWREAGFFPIKKGVNQTIVEWVKKSQASEIGKE